jgi:hypothetical protein
MKKFLLFVSIVCMTLFAASCIEPAAEETPQEITQPGETVFTATMAEPGTKVQLNEDATGLHVLWSPGDKIALFHSGRTKADEFISRNSEPSATTEFTGTLTPVETSTDPYFYAIFPKHGTADKYNNGKITPQLDASQIYATPETFSYGFNSSGSVGSGAVFVGRSETHSIQFYNVCSFLRFKITDREDIRSVVLTSSKTSNKEGICGSFDVTFDDNNIPTMNEGSGSKKTITLSPADGEAFQKNVWYYMTLLPVSFTQGATITLNTETESAVRTINGTLDKPLTFKRNECRSIASIDAGASFTNKVSATISQNGKTVSATTLWPKGTTTLSASLKGPLGDIDATEWTWNSDDLNNGTISLTNGVITAVSEGTSVVTAKTTYKDVEYSATVTVTVTEAASRLVAKPFTVDDKGTKVFFAPGNLYTGDGGTHFSFNTYQGQIVSYDQGSWLTTGARDKFTWNEWKDKTSAENISITDTYSLYKETQSLTDLSGWSMPTYPQWDYILMSRKNREGQDINRFAKATINGIPGLLLFPDEYVHPNNIAALANVNTKNASFSSNMFYGSDWVCMEENGVVFLPSAGMTNETWSGNSYVYTNGYYWSSCLKVTEGVEKNPIRLRFYSGVDTYSTNVKNQYLSIRLVRPVTE